MLKSMAVLILAGVMCLWIIKFIIFVPKPPK